MARQTRRVGFTVENAALKRELQGCFEIRFAINKREGRARATKLNRGPENRLDLTKQNRRGKTGLSVFILHIFSSAQATTGGQEGEGSRAAVRLRRVRQASAHSYWTGKA